VALTRAKKHLQVSFAASDNLGKPLEQSLFIDEISLPDDRIQKRVSQEDLMLHMQWAMEPVPDVRIELANHQWIERLLLQFNMSATTLSKYLRCPLSFYYENILRAPFQKNDALAFGSAVHTALERMFKSMKENNGIFPQKEDVLAFFATAMYIDRSCFTQVQYDRRMEQGRTIITEYYDKYIDSFSKEVEVELKINRYLLDGVPVTGKIDKLELEGDSCIVIDYKTGDPDRSANISGPNDKDPIGGDYWRQMVFYKLLLENYQEKSWKVKTGIFDFIEKSKKTNQYRRIEVPVFADDEDIVRKQLKDSYTAIMNHEFDKGCGEPGCNWCNFAKQYQLVRPADMSPVISNAAQRSEV
jgi:DNA helicase-2/ATP-dependent DNA helicase PcrA